MSSWTVKLLIGFVFYTQVSGHTKEHWAWQTALEIYQALELLLPYKTYLQGKPPKTTMVLTWDDLTFHLCFRCWSLLGYMFVLMAVMALWEQTWDELQTNSEISNHHWLAEGRKHRTPSREPANYLKMFIALQSRIWENILLANVYSPNIINEWLRLH